jgi:hypothetical protein
MEVVEGKTVKNTTLTLKLDAGSRLFLTVLPSTTSTLPV